MTDPKIPTEQLHTFLFQNPFVTLLQIQPVELQAGKAVLSMPVNNEYTNYNHSAHGGALAALADTTMGMACATTGKKVVTLDINLNYIRNIPCLESLTAIATLLHNGSRTMVAETNIFNSANQLVVSARATFFVTGTIL